MKDSKLTPALVEKLLDKLSTDNKFRALFRRDPKAAMIELGAPADFKCGRCLEPEKLASKEEIKKTRVHIRSKLLGDDTHGPGGLEPHHHKD